MSSQWRSPNMMLYLSHLANHRSQSVGFQKFIFSGTSTAIEPQNTGACSDVVTGCSSFAIPKPGSEIGSDAWRLHPLVVQLDRCYHVLYRAEGYINEVKIGKRLTHVFTRAQPSTKRNTQEKSRSNQISSPIYEPPAAHNAQGSSFDAHDNAKSIFFSAKARKGTAFQGDTRDA